MIPHNDPIIEHQLDRADHLLTADELRIKYGTMQGGNEHPRFSRWDWKQEVASDSTLRAYWDWVEAQIEQAHDKEG